MKKEVPKYHKEKIARITNGRCVLEWDMHMKCYIVKEKVRECKYVTADVGCLINVYYPIFHLWDFKTASPKPISDYVYEELWKRNRNNYEKNAVKNICKKVYDDNLKIKEKAKQDASDAIQDDIKNKFIKGRQYYT